MTYHDGFASTQSWTPDLLKRRLGMGEPHQDQVVVLHPSLDRQVINHRG
jgi:hypothetical protein